MLKNTVATPVVLFYLHFTEYTVIGLVQLISAIFVTDTGVYQISFYTLSLLYSLIFLWSMLSMMCPHHYTVKLHLTDTS